MPGNPPDVISVDVPLFLRLLEFAREDATDDMALHRLTENLLTGMAAKNILTMDDYDKVVPQQPRKVEASVMKAMRKLEQKANVAPSWFTALSPQEQETYKRAHPHSQVSMHLVAPMHSIITKMHPQDQHGLHKAAQKMKAGKPLDKDDHAHIENLVYHFNTQRGYGKAQGAMDGLHAALSGLIAARGAHAIANGDDSMLPWLAMGVGAGYGAHEVGRMAHGLYKNLRGTAKINEKQAKDTLQHLAADVGQDVSIEGDFNNFDTANIISNLIVHGLTRQSFPHMLMQIHENVQRPVDTPYQSNDAFMENLASYYRTR